MQEDLVYYTNIIKSSCLLNQTGDLTCFFPINLCPVSKTEANNSLDLQLYYTECETHKENVKDLFS